MKGTALALGTIALAFAVAEVVRPTKIPPKENAARALLRASQAVPGGAENTLGAEMLDDVPRIHPDAVGTIRTSHRSDGSVIVDGTANEPGGHSGAAVFIVVDGRRLGSPRAAYGRAPHADAYAMRLAPAELAAGAHRLRVGLISADQRGLFLLPGSVTVKVVR